MKRSPLLTKGALPPRPATQWGGGEVTPRGVAERMTDTRSHLVVPLQKENAVQHAGYMNLVRGLPCAHCGRAPRSEFCHADAGKGTGIKTDCRLGWPGCKDDFQNHREGCHTLIGSRGLFTKSQRRAIELTYARRTRELISARGQWPARLPRWYE